MMLLLRTDYKVAQERIRVLSTVGLLLPVGEGRLHVLNVHRVPRPVHIDVALLVRVIDHGVDAGSQLGKSLLMCLLQCRIETSLVSDADTARCLESTVLIVDFVADQRSLWPLVHEILVSNDEPCILLTLELLPRDEHRCWRRSLLLHKLEAGLVSFWSHVAPWDLASSCLCLCLLQVVP